MTWQEHERTYDVRTEHETNITEIEKTSQHMHRKRSCCIYTFIYMHMLCHWKTTTH